MIAGGGSATLMLSIVSFMAASAKATPLKTPVASGSSAVGAAASPSGPHVVIIRQRYVVAGAPALDASTTVPGAPLAVPGYAAPAVTAAPTPGTTPPAGQAPIPVVGTTQPTAIQPPAAQPGITQPAPAPTVPTTGNTGGSAPQP